MATNKAKDRINRPDVRGFEDKISSVVIVTDRLDISHRVIYNCKN